MRAALYTRVSSQEQAQHGISLAEQRDRLEGWAKVEGWEIAGFYSDEGYTGGNDSRPELQRMMKDAKSGLFEAIIVTKLDRFFRNTRLLLNYIHDLELCNVHFMAQAEGINTLNGGMGKVTLNLLGSIAEWEHDRIAERIRDFRSFRARQGRWSSGRTPFGYRFDKESKELIIEPDEAAAVKFIFNTYTGKQIGITRTAEACNKEGLITPRMGRRKHTTWTQATVRHILTHPAFKGGPSELWQFKTPAIIKPELWDAARRQLTNNRHFRDTENHSPFTGYLKCGLCGHTLRLGYNHNVLAVWECPGRLKVNHLDGSARCTLPRLPSSVIKNEVTLQIEEIFNNPESINKHIESTISNLQKERALLERKMRPIKAEIERIQAAMKKTDTMWEINRLSEDDYRARIAGLRKRLSELEKRTTEADPMLLEKAGEIEKSIKYYEQLPDMLSAFNDSVTALERVLPGVKKAYDEYGGSLSTVFKTNKKIKHDGFVEYRDGTTEAVAKFLQQYEMYVFVYPDKLEIKGAIRHDNISSAYNKDISLPLCITIELVGGGRR